MPDAARAIRVFVSSTFRDFIAERDRLARFCFPKLRRTCEERAVVFTDVDLRWGITDEQAAEGRVLPICLAEIDASRPFFIGILGERYGWVPDSISEELVERHQWLAEHRTRSVTELEIVHGVLNDPAMDGRSFFYFRDRNASLALDPDATPESETARERLADLKARIRASGLPVREGFSTTEELDAAVVADLTDAIDGIFPKDEVPDARGRERMVHDAFGYELAAGFVLRPDLLAALEVHANGDSPPLLVTGRSGSGKSALLAHWSRAYATDHADTPVITHFCGASAASSDWVSLCRRVAAELGRATGVAPELPDNPGDLKSAFKNLLFRAAAATPFVLVLDGVDQIEDHDGALGFSFLPPAPPARCRLLISSAGGARPVEEAQRRGWGRLTVGELTPAQRPAVLLSLLSRRAKALDAARVTRICAAPAAASPLFLSVLADELSVVGSHDTLDETLARYLAVEEAGDIYARVLERYERDYEARQGLVCDTMRAVWAARRGITERELLELLGAGRPLPQALLAPLLLAAGRQLTSRGGLLTFAHALLRVAVEDRYLEGENSKHEAHKTLADLFDRDRMSARSVDELPWQLQQATEWERLAVLLAGLEFLEAANFEDVQRCWVVLESKSSFRVPSIYQEAIAGATGAPGEIRLALLMSDRGFLTEASVLYRAGIAASRAAGALLPLSSYLGNLAGLLVNHGDLDDAMKQYTEAERICREIKNFHGLQGCLGNQAVILYKRGNLDGAMALLKEQERICREHAYPVGVQASLGHQGAILRIRNDLDGAVALLNEQERICRELGDPAILCTWLAGQARILKARGDLDGAIALLKEQERICRELGALASLQLSVGIQATILTDRGDLEGAMALLKEQERICRELGATECLSDALDNRARILYELGDLDGAMALLKDQERICNKLGDLAPLQRSFGNQALIFKALGEIDDAMALLKEQERICREHGNSAGLRFSLTNQALILKARGDLDGADALLKEQERVCREFDDPVSLHRYLVRRALDLQDHGDLNGAMQVLREQELSSRFFGDDEGLRASLGNQALILYTRGDLDGAMLLFKGQERVCRKIDDIRGLQFSLRKQADILKARGNLDGAMVVAGEIERIHEDLGPTAEQIRRGWDLSNRADRLLYAGQPAEALPLIEESVKIARYLGSETLDGRLRLLRRIRGALSSKSPDA